jgi:hypothetical protein
MPAPDGIRGGWLRFLPGRGRPARHVPGRCNPVMPPAGPSRSTLEPLRLSRRTSSSSTVAKDPAQRTGPPQGLPGAMTWPGAAPGEGSNPPGASASNRGRGSPPGPGRLPPPGDPESPCRLQALLSGTCAAGQPARCIRGRKSGPSESGPQAPLTASSRLTNPNKLLTLSGIFADGGGSGAGTAGFPEGRPGRVSRILAGPSRTSQGFRLPPRPVPARVLPPRTVRGHGRPGSVAGGLAPGLVRPGVVLTPRQRRFFQGDAMMTSRLHRTVRSP